LWKLGENKTKQENQGHESKRKSIREVEGDSFTGGCERIIEMVNMIKVHYLHIWKYDETPYYVQFNICQ
jgi:hypothetical protein